MSHAFLVQLILTGLGIKFAKIAYKNKKIMVGWLKIVCCLALS